MQTRAGVFLVLTLLELATRVPRAGAQSAGPVPGASQPRTKAQYEAFAMTHGGDAARGRALFADGRKLACGQCHSVDGRGGTVGPDLRSIGDKFGRRELVEAVLSPSAAIAVGYETTIVRTRSGDVFDGIVREATDAGLALACADGQVVRIDAADVLERRAATLSMMPKGLQGALTFQEFADLIDYLASLRLPENATPVRRGMPATIEELSTPVALKPFNAPGHKFTHPCWFGPVPGVPDAYAVVEHETGVVWLLDKHDGGETKTPFLEAGRNMRGAHGLQCVAFHPRFAENRRYFMVDQIVENGRFVNRLLDGVAAADLRHDSGRPRRELIRVDASTANHCGGGLEFGPDGYLYFGMGDTGPQQDPHGNAQDMNLLRGKMARIDVDHPAGGLPYGVPADNPFVGRAGVRPEIWAAGLRNPWRYSFDPATGDLWVGDVGQDLYEEVDVVRRGENYGWNVYEGFVPFSNQYRRAREAYAPPVFAYARKYGVSITGGYVYRADAKSSFYGVYVCGDYESKRIFGLTQEGRALAKVRQIGRAPQRIVSFGRGARGELYLLGYEGTVYEMDFAPARFA
jgi:putative heme-binding domain-containing protein